MRKFKKEKQTVEVEKTIDILCNKCGKSCFNESLEFSDPEGLIEVKVAGGYNSTVIGDLRSWRFSVCERCLSAFVKTFKIPVDVKDHELHDFVPAPEAEKISQKAYKKNMIEQCEYFVKQENLKIKGLKVKLNKMKAESIRKYLDKLKDQVSDSKLSDIREEREEKVQLR